MNQDRDARRVGSRSLAGLSVAAMVGALLVAGAGVAGAGVGTGAALSELWVNATSGDDGSTCESETVACKTIQAAIGKALVGATVHVAAGNYWLSATNNITIATAGIELEGPNAGIDPNTDARGSEATLYAGGFAPSDSPAIAIEANGVTIDGFELIGRGILSKSAHDGGVIQNNVIRDLSNEAKDSQNRALNPAAIDTRSGNDWRIENNRITNWSDHDTASGIFLRYGSGVVVSGNVIDTTSYSGIIATQYTDVTIEGNSVYNTPSRAINIEKPRGPYSISDNEIIDTAYDEGRLAAIRVYNVEAPSSGSDPVSLAIDHNVVWGNSAAVIFDDNGDSTSFSADAVITMHRNDFGDTANEHGAKLVTLVDASIDATENWWGVAQPDFATVIPAKSVEVVENPMTVANDVITEFGNEIAPSVEYDPWCTNAACTTFSNDPVTPPSGGGPVINPPATPAPDINVLGAACEEDVFPDVDGDNTFCGAVAWLKDNGITVGSADGKFHPTEQMTRGMMAAMIYRMKTGKSEVPACSGGSFADVASDETFCGAIEWLKDQGISLGSEDGGFHPGESMTRGAMAAFLYRMQEGSGAAPACSAAPFPDVAVDDTFCGEIAWMKAEGITLGALDGGYHAGDPITRQEMAAFLFRIGSAG